MVKRVKSWFVGLSRAAKVLVVSIALLLGISAHGNAGNQTIQNASSTKTASSTSKTDGTNAQARKHEPTIIHKTVTQDEVIPFSSQSQNDADLESGKTVMVTTGVDGVKTHS